MRRKGCYEGGKKGREGRKRRKEMRRKGCYEGGKKEHEGRKRRKEMDVLKEGRKDTKEGNEGRQ